MSSWYKKSIMLLFVLVILSSTVFGAFGNSTIMGTTDCPDDTTAQVLMFAFIGIFMLAMLWFSEKMIRIPFFTILIGMGMMFYSFTLYSCHITLGYMTSAFALGIIMFKWFWRDKK